MVKLIMGPKGTGKTKQLVELVKKALEEESGNVVVLEKDKNLTYDIPYTARLIHASDYPFGAYEFFHGFLCGLHAGNYDISHVFIDNFFKMFSEVSDAEIVEFLDGLADFSEKEGVNFTISATADPATAPEGVKKFF